MTGVGELKNVPATAVVRPKAWYKTSSTPAPPDQQQQDSKEIGPNWKAPLSWLQDPAMSQPALLAEKEPVNAPTPAKKQSPKVQPAQQNSKVVTVQVKTLAGGQLPVETETE